MRLTVFALSFAIAGPCMAEIKERPLSGDSFPAKNELDDATYPVAKEPKKQVSYKNTAQSSQYPFPAPRHLLESAADKCSEEIAQIWAQQNALEPYRRSHFQKCMGEANQRCKKLRQLAESMKAADEELFSYQQAILDAQKVFQ